MTRFNRATSALIAALLIALATAPNLAAQDFESEATDTETHTLDSRSAPPGRSS